MGKPYSRPEFQDILQQQILPIATYSPWLNDHEFQEAYQKSVNNTLVDIYRCYELYTVAKQLKNVGGCFLEVGVWRGGTGAILASAAKITNQERAIYLADTFEGVVKAGEKDSAYRGGEHADTSKDLVIKLLDSMKLSNVKVLEGIFPDKTAQYVNEPIALLHCDVDVYQSAKEIVDWAMPRLKTGGVIIFDDYGFSGCEGITRYVNELRNSAGFFFTHNINGHAIFLKQ